ncbi:MAG TPA: hypothetical protein EYQ27_07455 [Gemmatimonadetes bacterium]|jgi:hypothetical protein|nr:hypothetical protein [Gemmatimonadota bacterium]
MRTSWEAGRQEWEIFIDDPGDPALVEFGFPDAARDFLEHAASWVERLAPTEAVSRRFFARLKRYLDRGQVQVMCLAEAGPRG